MGLTRKEAAISVMVVDDNEMMRLLMGQMLKLGGYSIVTEAADGCEAVAKYKQLRPALTVMDIIMPHKNGIDATREIISINTSAKIIMCSSMGHDGLIQTAEEAGACGVIFKPYIQEQVFEIINSVMQEQLSR